VSPKGPLLSMHTNTLEVKMKRAPLATSLLLTLLTALYTVAQNPNYDKGSVWRMAYYDVKPGQLEPFWKDFRENLKPSYDALKKEGIILDYKVWTNETTDGPNDWDVALALLFPTWAGMDQYESKAATIIARHYGSREAMVEAGKKRNEYRAVVGIKLWREAMPD